MIHSITDPSFVDGTDPLCGALATPDDTVVLGATPDDVDCDACGGLLAQLAALDEGLSVLRTPAVLSGFQREAGELRRMVLDHRVRTPDMFREVAQARRALAEVANDQGADIACLRVLYPLAPA